MKRNKKKERTRTKRLKKRSWSEVIAITRANHNCVASQKCHAFGVLTRTLKLVAIHGIGQKVTADERFPCFIGYVVVIWFQINGEKKNEQNWYILYNEPNKRQKLSALC